MTDPDAVTVTESDQKPGWWHVCREVTSDEPLGEVLRREPYPTYSAAKARALAMVRSGPPGRVWLEGPGRRNKWEVWPDDQLTLD